MAKWRRITPSVPPTRRQKDAHALSPAHGTFLFPGLPFDQPQVGPLANRLAALLLGDFDRRKQITSGIGTNAKCPRRRAMSAFCGTLESDLLDLSSSDFDPERSSRGE